MMSDARKVALVVIKTKRLHEVFLANAASEFSLRHVPKLGRYCTSDFPSMPRDPLRDGVFQDGKV